MEEQNIKKAIEDELIKRNKSIRNANAIDRFLEVFLPPVAVLKDILSGSKRAVEYERQIITLDKILEVVISIDNTLSGGTTHRRVGILNRGKNNKYLNNSFINLDVGIQDEGEGTIAEGNKFLQGY